MNPRLSHQDRQPDAKNMLDQIAMTGKLDAAEPFSPFALDHLQDAAQFFLAAQSQPPFPDTASEYQSSSAQSASGDPTPEPDVMTGRRPSTVSRKSSENAHRGHKHKWSAEETQALVDGCNKHGVGSWKKILSDPTISGHFCDRTAGDLKDRFRTYFPDSYHELYPNAKTHLSKAVRGRDSEGKSIFEKGKTKERRPFTPEEDAELRNGFLQHGTHWALIAKDPIFQGQRRAIDLRDRFRNAFPDDYERAGFKLRPSKAKKDRSTIKAGNPETSAEVLSSVSDHGLSDHGWRGDYSTSDAASDGHLTDHSIWADQSNVIDTSEPLLSNPSSRASSVLGRSSSFHAGGVQQISSQRSHTPLMPTRPQYSSAQTAPVHGIAQRPSDMVTGQSISHLFEQLQQASLDGQSRPGSSHLRNLSTPPSASESEPIPLLSSPLGPGPDETRHTIAKHSTKDHAIHKRRSHASKAGKNSVLERMPSVHGHLHGHAHHPHSHATSHPQPNAVQETVPASTTAGTSQSDVLTWLDPGQSTLQNTVRDVMDVDEDAPPAEPWLSYNFGADPTRSTAEMPQTNFDRAIEFNTMAEVRREDDALLMQQSGSSNRPDLPVRSSSFHGAGSFVDEVPSSSAIELARRSSSALNLLAQQPQLRQLQQQFLQQAMDEKADSFSSQMDLFQDPLQDFLDPLTPSSAAGPGWNSGWNVSSVSESGRDDEVGAMLSSLPLSHHHWAGDLHHHSMSATSWYNSQPQQIAPSYFGGADLSVQSSASSTGGAGDLAYAQPASNSNDVIRAMSVDAAPQQALPTRTNGLDTTYEDDRPESPDSLELNREQTFTARDVVHPDEDDEAESGDDQRRRSTDTLRRAEGGLEQALESVEDTRALQFAQQFHHDEDSDEEADSGDDDGYEEDEEDDDELDQELDTQSGRSFNDVFNNLGAGVSYAASLPDTTLSNDFLDGPYGSTTASGQSGVGPAGFSVDDSNLALYQDLSRSPRFTADAQAFLSSLNQDVPSWASALSDSEMLRPYRSAQSPSATRSSFGAAVALPGARPSSSAVNQANRARLQQDGSTAPTEPASFLSAPAAQAVSLAAPPMAPTFGSGSGGAGGMSMDSLWATSGSLDRLEHLYLEGLHSSPALGHASASGLGSGGSYTTRPGWMSNPGELAGSQLNNTSAGTGYLSE